jgi:hypothetical protein
VICSSCHNDMASICEECDSKERKAIRLHVARRCFEMAMAKCRELNGRASALNREGRYDLAAERERFADEYSRFAAAIDVEFGLSQAVESTTKYPQNSSTNDEQNVL